MAPNQPYTKRHTPSYLVIRQAKHMYLTYHDTVPHHIYTNQPTRSNTATSAAYPASSAPP